MASILDVGLVGLFRAVFVFLLVYTIIWGVLSWKKWMGEQPGVYAMIAFSIAFIMAAAPDAQNFILFIAPWYVALALVIFFILFIVSMFGLSGDKDFPKIIKSPQAYNWIIILAVVIFVIGLAFSLGQSLLSSGTGTTPPTQQPVNTVGGGDGSFQQSMGALQSATAGGPTSTGDFGSNLLNTIVHPKVLGMIITLLIMSVAVYFLSGPASKPN